MSQLSNLIQQVSSTKKATAKKAATIAAQLNLPLRRPSRKITLLIGTPLTALNPKKLAILLPKS